jgi:hypothetical protein
MLLTLAALPLSLYSPLLVCITPLKGWATLPTRFLKRFYFYVKPT